MSCRLIGVVARSLVAANALASFIVSGMYAASLLSTTAGLVSFCIPPFTAVL